MKRARIVVGLVVILTAVVGCSLRGRAQAPAQTAPNAVPGTTAQQAIDAAAAALGGADKLRGLRNLTLIGYAQYAYQNGGGNISPLPGAPQKFIAANDYRRVYDLQNMRMLHQERRNDLFPFANYGGHSFALARQGLDGAAMESPSRLMLCISLIADIDRTRNVPFITKLRSCSIKVTFSPALVLRW